MHRPCSNALPPRVPSRFFGPTAVRAAFVLALFGWGVGFYGPSVYLHAVVERTGWSVSAVSAAVTLHYLFGALVVTRLPGWHRRHGVGPVAIVGAATTALGVLGWALAAQPWELAVAALATGAGWVTMGAVALNAIVASWYVRGRPVALATAYNGASIGGVVFTPLWAVLITQVGFAWAAVLVGAVMVVVVGWLARVALAPSPAQLGQRVDGDAPGDAPGEPVSPARPLPAGRLWRDRRFMTLALGMSTGLFAQIGLISHLYMWLVQVIGAQPAGLAMGFATACAIAGRMVAARAMQAGADRRCIAAAAYAVQVVGVLTLLVAGHGTVSWIVAGLALFGSGIGNATSLPPLIAQAEFAASQVARVVALVVAMAQASYALAPAAFGVLLDLSAGDGRWLFAAAAAVQVVAITCFLAGRRQA